jgi:hypothetical protein
MIGECICISIKEGDHLNFSNIIKKSNSIDELIFSMIGNCKIKHVNNILYSSQIDKQDLSRRLELVSEYLNKIDLKANVTKYNSGIRVEYIIPNKQPSVDIIIPTKNGYNILKKCVYV